MQQYEYIDIYKGKPRKLLILIPHEGLDFRVFCEADFLGSIRCEQDGDASIWKTDYNILKPIVSKIGAHIERCKALL